MIKDLHFKNSRRVEKVELREQNNTRSMKQKKCSRKLTMMSMKGDKSKEWITTLSLMTKVSATRTLEKRSGKLKIIMKMAPKKRNENSIMMSKALLTSCSLTAQSQAKKAQRLQARPKLLRLVKISLRIS